MLALKKLDKKIIAIQKTICGMPKCMSNKITQLPHNLFGLEAFSSKNAYLRCIGGQLQNALNDKGRLGRIYNGLTQYILAQHGGADNIPRIKKTDCMKSPITRTFFLLKHEGKVYLKSTLQNFLFDLTPLEIIWQQETQKHTTLNTQLSQKLLQKLLSKKYF